MTKITPNIWCQGTADEVAEFYESVFSETPGGIRINHKETYPTEGLLEFQQDLAGKTLQIDLEIGDLPFILINAGEEFLPNPALNFLLNFDPSVDPHARTLLDTTWEKLSEGGTVLMELGEYPFSPHYGWVADKYGVNWQLILTDPAGESRPFVIPSFMFGGASQNQAAQAQEKYVSVFPHSELGMRAEYPQQTGPAEPGSLMFSEFQLNGQWFSAMDSGVEQDFTFTEGVSLMYEAHGQDELDRIWDALSAVPESEQCGWLKDEFGVSWQIVPDNMAELMSRPGAFEKLMTMGKIQIENF